MGVPGPPRLVARVRAEARVRHYSARTERAYVAWARRYVRFHGLRHPADLGREEIARFLSSLALEGRVSPSTQAQATAALLFLYRRVLGRDPGWLEGIVRAKKPRRVRLAYAFGRKSPGAAWEWAWQWVFPAGREHLDSWTGKRYRRHLHPAVVQRAVREAVRKAGIAKRATSQHDGAYAARGITGTRSRRTCSRTVTTSGRCRSCWATATCPRR